jgi:type I site-specific restriction-modification system R (restriction) subunit
LIDFKTFGAIGTLLRELLDVANCGMVFTTIQKFFPDEKGGKHPLLSDRRNIVVIADEAHHSQYDSHDSSTHFDLKPVENTF